MSQGGRICRKVGRGGGDAAYELDVSEDAVRVLVRGRVVRTLTGADAEAVRAVLDDPAALERLDLTQDAPLINRRVRCG